MKPVPAGTEKGFRTVGAYSNLQPNFEESEMNRTYISILFALLLMPAIAMAEVGVTDKVITVGSVLALKGKAQGLGKGSISASAELSAQSSSLNEMVAELSRIVGGVNKQKRPKHTNGNGSFADPPNVSNAEHTALNLRGVNNFDLVDGGAENNSALQKDA